MRYQKKISGPLLDRIDIHIEVPRIKYDELKENKSSESSKIVRERVEAARKRQNERFAQRKIKTNSEMGSKEIREFCVLDTEAETLIGAIVDSMKLSARVYHRLLKIARTIADLENSDIIKRHHIAEAVQYRPKEKTY